ncbi:hypothetical protein CCMA1212_004619 [Trichoderma ghanense]|uniref:SSCRP protein n=1 Tax=Trichoderma ghanense TaxID=65468 RepID=A0ABY2H779_9HYPO
MAPGYRSPFDHPPPHPKTGRGDHRSEAMLPSLAIILCISAIICIALIAIRSAAESTSVRGRQHGPKDDVLGPRPDMALNEAPTLNHLVERSEKEPPKVTDIRHMMLQEEAYDAERGDVQQPLLPAEEHSSPLGEHVSIIELAARQDDIRGKGSINWHGSNTLNTSWGWMA